MCTTYTDYWRCGHLRRRRIVTCHRDYNHFMDREPGKTYSAECDSCWREARDARAAAPAERDYYYRYYSVRRLYQPRSSRRVSFSL
ncbi:hypothetical protein MFIFM68171_08671 [Madurella fahalii]|uniref:Uncharacterized protein n=1 Tax=Madurella fahalii TaxID=1157608 RepID=A0ABQ0GL57_9PEZI